jgi:polyisoprenoid-binding protein YceI
MKIWKLFWVSYLFPTIVMAAEVPKWQIAPEQSSLTFTAIQNDAPIKGKFTDFSGDIQFDPNQLKDSKVVLKVKTNSLSTTLQDVSNTLKTADWLSTDKFPEASFETISFNKKDTQHYQAEGNLTILNKTFPANVDFEVLNFSPEKAQIKGTATFKRTQWGIGKGEWANTNDIKDNIQIDFNLNLTPNK